MKKITSCLAIIVVLFIDNNAVMAQSFQKGNINVDIGIGFGIYGTSQTFTNTLTFGGVTTLDKSDTTDATASRVIPINLEYGLTDKIGIGLDFTYGSYFINDSDKVSLESVKAYDFGPRLNYHLLNSNRNDLMIGVGIGFSTISWDFNSVDITNPLEPELASGAGFYWTLGLTDRIFFSDHIGILFNLSYKGYTYSKIEYELTPEAQQILTNANATFNQEFKWQLNGANIGIGLAIKL